MSTPAPPPPTSKYDARLNGVWGVLGPTQGLGVTYLQTAVSVDQLSWLSLVKDIPGSEQWPVRELFQRDIDEARVGTGLIPYFKDRERAKFFNPLTIAVLPMRSGRILGAADLPPIEIKPQDEGGHQFAVKEIPDFYAFWSCRTEPAYSRLEWRRNAVQLVAIDGQHRLSALLRLYGEWKQNPDNPDLLRVQFGSWRIPLVLIVTGATHAPGAPGVLETIRSIFVTVNTMAEKPTRSRAILLTDDSVTAVCCQELLQACHTGSVPLPLEMFEWRSHKESEHGTVESATALTRIDELEDLHIAYLLGENGLASDPMSADQRQALQVDEMDPALDTLTGRAWWEACRARYASTVMRLCVAVYTDVVPYKAYIQFLEALQSPSDVRIHALSRIRFGADAAPLHLRATVDEEVAKLEDLIAKKREQIPELLRRDIGLRAIFSAAVAAKRTLDEATSKTSTWDSFAAWFVPKVNEAIKHGWFDRKQPLLRHLVVDHNDNIVNYRLDDVPSAYGALIGLVCCSQDVQTRALWESHFREDIDDCLFRGFQKEVRPALKQQLLNAPDKELREAVKSKARKETDKQMKHIIKKLSLPA